MEVIYKRSESLLPLPSAYCAGCHHGTVQKLIAEIADEMNIAGKLAIVYGVGCYTMSNGYFNLDMMPALHGRGPAVGSGFKRVRPDQPLIVYQGDGDAAAIGMAETVHAAARGENFTVIMVNNQIYGMTGGQLAPTTLVGQLSTTSRDGRTIETQGYPLGTAEIVATLTAPKYVARVAVDTVAHINAARKAIMRALEIQMREGGYSFIEVISACPTSWKVRCEDIPAYLEEHVFKVFPLGEFKKA